MVYFNVIIYTCQTNAVEDQKIELKNQLIGLTSAHNARQLGGYRIGNQRIKDNLLLRSAKISELSKEDSTLLCDQYKVQCIYDFRGKKESLSAPDVIPGKARYLSLALSFGGEGSETDTKFENEEQMIGMQINETKDLNIAKEKFGNDQTFDIGLKLLEKYDLKC